jgi:hypothetical protein
MKLGLSPERKKAYSLKSERGMLRKTEEEEVGV